MSILGLGDDAPKTIEALEGIIDGLRRELAGVRGARDANHDEKVRFENIAANQMDHIRELKHRVQELKDALQDKPRTPTLASALDAAQTAFIELEMYKKRCVTLVKLNDRQRNEIDILKGKARPKKVRRDPSA